MAILEGPMNGKPRIVGSWAVLALGLLTLGPSAAWAQVVEYYHLDALGSVRAVTNQAGQVVERHDYLPFGEECTAAPCSTTLPGTNTFKFTGKERDGESGLDYFKARYYRAHSARFTGIDPVLNTGATLPDPQRWNRYAYVRNNPFRYVDPDGEDLQDVVNGGANAVVSNFLFGSGRQSGNADFTTGQFAGDLVSIVLGALEMTGGSLIATKGAGTLGVGAFGTGATAGGGLPVTGPVIVVGVGEVVVGGALVVHGGTAGISGSAHAGTFLANKINDLKNRMGGGTPGNNQAQNKQFRDAVREIEHRLGGISLDKDQRRQLHDDITGQDMGYQEIVERGVAMFGGS
jgi:RHS repeat-associated protein